MPVGPTTDQVANGIKRSGRIFHEFNLADLSGELRFHVPPDSIEVYADATLVFEDSRGEPYTRSFKAGVIYPYGPTMIEADESDQVKVFCAWC